jgi:hypothetical protein
LQWLPSHSRKSKHVILGTLLNFSKLFRTVFLDTWTFPGVDSISRALHDICMMLETETKGSQRRSSRVFTRIPVRATGKDLLGKKFQETSQTIVINAHGGLLYLQAELKVGAELVLINPATEEEQDCRVVYLGDTSEKGTRIGVEFLSPSPHFWGVEFAPQDWPTRAAPRPVH